GGQQVVGHGQRLVLAGEDHRHAQLDARHDRRSDAGRLDGDDLGDAVIAKAAGKLLADLLHQQGDDLVVQECVDLEYAVGKYDVFITDLRFQLSHERATSSWAAGFA